MEGAAASIICNSKGLCTPNVMIASAKVAHSMTQHDHAALLRQARLQACKHALRHARLTAASSTLTNDAHAANAVT